MKYWRRSSRIGGGVWINMRFEIRGIIGKIINRILRIFNLEIIVIAKIDMFRLQDLRNRGFIPKQILDIGASNGTWTRECLRVFPNAQYFLIDPLEENRDALEKLRQQSSNKVDFIIGAAGSSVGRMKFNVEKGLNSSSFLKYTEPIVTTIPREVQVLTTNNLIRANKINMPDLIKIDVEGFELEVLKGCSMIWSHTECIILETSFFEFAEGMPLFHEVIGYMASKEYVFYDI